MHLSVLASSPAPVTVMASPLVSLFLQFLRHNLPLCANLWPARLKQHVNWCNKNSEGKPKVTATLQGLHLKKTPSALVVFRSRRSLSHTELSHSIMADKFLCYRYSDYARGSGERESLPTGRSVVKGQWAITLDMYPNLCDPAVATGEVFPLEWIKPHDKKRWLTLWGHRAAALYSCWGNVLNDLHYKGSIHHLLCVCVCNC